MLNAVQHKRQQAGGRANGHTHNRHSSNQCRNSADFWLRSLRILRLLRFPYFLRFLRFPHLPYSPHTVSFVQFTLPIVSSAAAFVCYAPSVAIGSTGILLTVIFRYLEIIRNYRKAAKGHSKNPPGKRRKTGRVEERKKGKSAMKGYLVASLESLLFGITQNLSSG